MNTKFMGKRLMYKWIDILEENKLTIFEFCKRSEKLEHPINRHNAYAWAKGRGLPNVRMAHYFTLTFNEIVGKIYTTEQLWEKM